MLKAGDTAPDFDATDCQGRRVQLSGLKGKKVVLFFFPKAFTPACTIEIRNFRDHQAAIEAKSANPPMMPKGTARPKRRSCCWSK